MGSASGSASRTGNCETGGTSETGGTGETSGKDGTGGRNGKAERAGNVGASETGEWKRSGKKIERGKKVIIMDNAIIYQKIESLSDRERALFAFSMAERMMPLYYDLCNNHTEIYDFSHYKELKNLLCKGFLYANNDIKIDYSTIEKIIDDCVYVLTPDMEEIATTISDLAQKPPLCVAYGFDYIINKNIKSINYCSDMPFQCFYICYELEENYNLIIAEEIETQKALLEEICSTRRLETIRDFNKNNMLTINTRAKM